jgi:hypothetical protein
MNDIASDLIQRFTYASYFSLSAWEHDPETHIVGTTIVRDKDREDTESKLIDTFEKLCDSVNAVPSSLIAKTEELRASLAPGKYEAVLIEAIQNVGRKSFPKDATEFVESLNSSLELAKA